MNKGIVVALVMVTGSTAYARLGETEGQLVKRYGAVQSRPHRDYDNKNLMVFKTSNGMTVTVLLDGAGKSVEEDYSGVMVQDDANSSHGTPLSTKTVEAILEANKGASTWEKE